MAGKRLWAYNAKTGDIFSYTISGELTDFPRGEFLAYWDYLTTGFESRAAAEEWAEEWQACPTCECIRKGPVCSFCGTGIVEEMVE